MGVLPTTFRRFGIRICWIMSGLSSVVHSSNVAWAKIIFRNLTRWDAVKSADDERKNAAVQKARFNSEFRFRLHSSWLPCKCKGILAWNNSSFISCFWKLLHGSEDYLGGKCKFSVSLAYREQGCALLPSYQEVPPHSQEGDRRLLLHLSFLSLLVSAQQSVCLAVSATTVQDNRIRQFSGVLGSVEISSKTIDSIDLLKETMESCQKSCDHWLSPYSSHSPTSSN